MGEAAEAVDDVAVQLGEAEKLGVAGLGAEGLDQAHAVGLVHGVLGMLQRHVDEVPQRRLDLQVESPAQGQAGDPASLAVRGEGVGAVPEDVAGDLVEQENQGQGRLGFLRPVVVMAPGGGEVDGLEAQAQGVVEGGVLAEPSARAGVAPVADDVLGKGGHGL